MDDYEVCVAGLLEKLTDGPLDKKENALWILTLRDLNRRACLEVKAARKEAQERKALCEQAELEHSKIQHEEGVLRRNLEESLNYSPLYLKIVEESSHETIVTKLKSELSHRRLLVEKVRTAKAELDLARSKLSLKRKELERMHEQLGGFLKAADPFVISHQRLRPRNEVKRSLLETLAWDGSPLWDLGKISYYSGQTVAEEDDEEGMILDDESRHDHRYAETRSRLLSCEHILIERTGGSFVIKESEDEALFVQYRKDDDADPFWSKVQPTLLTIKEALLALIIDP